MLVVVVMMEMVVMMVVMNDCSCYPKPISCLKHSSMSLLFRYCYDIRHSMFSAGNISEKIRVGSFICQGETVVDLFAGIVTIFFDINGMNIYSLSLPAYLIISKS